MCLQILQDISSFLTTSSNTTEYRLCLNGHNHNSTLVNVCSALNFHGLETFHITIDMSQFRYNMVGIGVDEDLDTIVKQLKLNVFNYKLKIKPDGGHEKVIDPTNQSLKILRKGNKMTLTTEESESLKTIILYIKTGQRLNLKTIRFTFSTMQQYPMCKVMDITDRRMARKVIHSSGRMIYTPISIIIKRVQLLQSVTNMGILKEESYNTFSFTYFQ